MKNLTTVFRGIPATLLLLFINLSAIAQTPGSHPMTDQYGHMGIGTTTPDKSAILDLSSTNAGFLLPRMTTAQRSALVNPAPGLMIFNTDTKTIEFNIGTSFAPAWDPVVTSSSGSGLYWQLLGNAGTNPAVNFIGTTDAQPLVVRTNSVERLRVTNTGEIGIGGTPVASRLLTVAGSAGTSNVRLGSTSGAADGSVWTPGANDGFVTADANGDLLKRSAGAAVGSVAWLKTGNSGTFTDGTDNLIGTTSNAALNVIVNGSRAMRYEPNGTSPNVIGGFSGNSVTSGVVGAVIAGGGADGSTNVVTDDFSVVSGGQNNRAGDGTGTTNDRAYATVGGGAINTASSEYATVGGGHNNTSSGSTATVAGGLSNVASGSYAMVGGGAGNEASGSTATVGGGTINTASGWNATVGGGEINTASSEYATVSGGEINTASSPSATVGGGGFNTASSEYATIGGGAGNTSSGSSATVGGGAINTSSGKYATVGGGEFNMASNEYATVGGGHNNMSSGLNATAGGGGFNTSSGQYATIGGGSSNTSSGVYATVSGGAGNTASGDYSAIPGGYGLTLTSTADRSFGFHANTAVADRDMSISASDVAVFGNTDLWLANNDNNPSELRFFEGYNTAGAFPNTANYTAFKAQTQSGDITYTLPASAPASSGDVLTSTTAGVMSWSSSTALAWGLTGNGGTTAGTNFLGTTDNQAFEIRVDNGGTATEGRRRVMRFEPNASSANIIGGFNGNSVTAGAVGGVVAGGGVNGNTNRVTDDYGVIGGGYNNQAGDAGGGTNDRPFATVSGGQNNVASGPYASVGGGTNDTASGGYATVGGGLNNRSTADWSTVSGGSTNEASNINATVGGGYRNSALGTSTTVGGGSDNTIVSDWGTIGGGLDNEVTSLASNYGVVSGGWQNSVSGRGGVISGGIGNRALEEYSTVGGGHQNMATDTSATVGGGNGNTASGYSSTVSGGVSNEASNPYATVSGGISNEASNPYATVSGGRDNTASGEVSTVSGGRDNTASGEGSTVGGGDGNEASNLYATVSGGSGNEASNLYATVSGGSGNTASNQYATVSGGRNNRALSYSATVSGGHGNIAAGDSATVSGGFSNRAWGNNSTVSGGYRNVAWGNNSTMGGGFSNEASGEASMVGGGRDNIDSGDYSAIPGGHGLTLTGTADRSFGFHANNSGATLPMSISASDVAVFGNTDLWLANNDNNPSELRFFEGYNTAGAFPNTANYTAFKAQTQASDITYTLPASNGTVGQALAVAASPAPTATTATLEWATISGGWQLTGNSGTTAGTNFLGTTDNQAFEIRIDNGGTATEGRRRVLRFEPNASSANIIGGFNGNSVTSGVVGATIAGGGANGNTNVVTDNYGVVGGGSNNRAGDNAGTTGDRSYGTVAGGYNNTASGSYSTVGGGDDNVASGLAATVDGGSLNTASGQVATVGGGRSNTASGQYATIGGGVFNTASNTGTTIAGGYFNTASGQYATVGGGTEDTIAGDYSVIPGGRGLTLTATADRSFGFHANTSTGTRNMTISASDIAVFGNTDLWLANNDNNPSELRFFEGYNTAGAFPNTANYSAFKAQNQSSDITYILPGTVGIVGDVLQITSLAGTTATLDWAAVSGGSVTVDSTLIGDGSGSSPLGLDLAQSNVWTATISTFSGFLESQNEPFVVTNNDNAANEIRIQEASGNGSNYMAFRADTSISTNDVWILPSTAGTVGEVLGITAVNTPSNRFYTLDWTTPTAAPKTTRTDVTVAATPVTLNATGASFIRITASTPGAFTLQGLSGGIDGQIVIVYNQTANNMTITHEDAGETATNRIHWMSGGSLTTTGEGHITLMYDGGQSRWIDLSYRP